MTVSVAFRVESSAWALAVSWPSPAVHLSTGYAETALPARFAGRPCLRKPSSASELRALMETVFEAAGRRGAGEAACAAPPAGQRSE